VVQSGAPDANRGRAFSKFETQNQIAWVVGGLMPVIFRPAGWLGFASIGVSGLVGVAVFVRMSGGLTTLRGERATNRGRPLRSE
jgi:hypothetical protein